MLSHRLVPGDVIVVLPGKATCDMVLLRGSCLVEEALLSGEVSYAVHNRLHIVKMIMIVNMLCQPKPNMCGGSHSSTGGLLLSNTLIAGDV